MAGNHFFKGFKLSVKKLTIADQF